MKPKIVGVSRQLPAWKSVYLAANIINSGGVISFPTDTTYGLAASIFCPSAIDRLRSLKERESNRPFLVIASDIDMVKELVLNITPWQRRLIDLYWPGPLTVIFGASDRVPAHVRSEAGTVAIRVPNDALSQAILRACGIPLAVPSANLKGDKPATSAHEVVRYFGDRIDLLLDGGELESTEPSTIVDATSRRIRVVRTGRLLLGNT